MFEINFLLPPFLLLAAVANNGVQGIDLSRLYDGYYKREAANNQLGKREKAGNSHMI